MAEQPTSHYLDYLPALLREDPFVGSFLLAFERLYSGLPDTDPETLPADPPLMAGFDQILDRIEAYVTPLDLASGRIEADKQHTPAEFLPWLAQWVALSLRDDWPEATKRKFISQMVPLYKQRGTKAGLITLLQLYTEEEVEIYELSSPPHYFQVAMTLSQADPDLLKEKERIARAIINEEKPAHTVYGLLVRIPTMQIINNAPAAESIGQQTGLVLGVNTLLGTESR